MAILIAAMGLYIWLDQFIRLEDEQLFILLVACFSVGTMLIYWLLFQPTRKIAKAVIRAIAKRANAEPVVEAVEQIVGIAEPNLQANAKEAAEKEHAAAQQEDETASSESELDKFHAMVEAIKHN